MSWIEETRFGQVVPSLNLGAGYQNLQLTPEEGFILSRVDGHSSIDEICLVVGLARAQTLATIEKLHGIGLLIIDGAPAPATAEGPRSASPAPAAGSAADAKASPGPSQATPAPARPADPPPSANVPPFEPDSACQLSEAKQQELHTIYHQLDDLDFYTLLNLQPGCDGREVQRAFRKVSLKYHPDRFYGKELGVYKARIDTIFRHISNVAEYLTDDAQRAAYEAELAGGAGGDETAAAEQTAAEEVAPEPTTGELEAVARAARGGRAPNTAEREAMGPARALSREERLRRLGGVLGMSTQELKAVARGRKTPTPEGPAPSLPELSAERKERLKAQTARRVSQQLASPVAQRRQKAKVHFDEGVKAMLQGNWAAAASNLKLATTFDPKNQEYREKEQIASARAREGAAESYAKRAAFEESVGRWEEAARLYTMATERHETVPHLTAASAALVRTGELKRAVEYAIKARDLNPNSLPARLALASAYLAAGMPKSARREVDYALKLDSDNRIAKALLKEIRKAD